MTGTPKGTKIERRLDRALHHATTPRGAAIVIASATIGTTVAAAFLMTIADRSSYPTIGSGLWWAVQTVTTVGYGDHVPESVAGQLVAALVMLFGIGFLSVITAAITSAFVSGDRSPLRTESPLSEQLVLLHGRLDQIETALTDSALLPDDATTLTTDHLRELEKRLDRIEAALKSRP